MRSGKLGHGRPESPKPARLLQELLDVYIFVDVSPGCEQHQSLFAPRREVCAVPIAGELPGAREETPEQGNPVDVRGRKLIPQLRVSESQVSQLVSDDERQGVLVLFVSVAEQLAVDNHKVVPEGGRGERVEGSVARHQIYLRNSWQAQPACEVFLHRVNVGKLT